MATQVKVNSSEIPAKPSPEWLIYFLATIGIVGFTAGYVITTPLFLLSFLIPPLRPIPAEIMCFAVRVLMWIQPWLKFEFRQDEYLSRKKNLKQKGVLFISNHRSHLDAFFMLSHIPGIRILAKKPLFYLLPLGWMMVMMRQIPIERKGAASFFQAMDRVETALCEYSRVHIFPEMTRSEEGAKELRDFVLAPFAVAIRTKSVVFPMTFRGTDYAWPKGSFGLRSGAQVVAEVLPPIEAESYPSAEALMLAVRDKIEKGLR